MIRSLYISYNAITEPVVRSQVIPYLRELAKKGIEFYLLTFEKKRMTQDEKRRIRKELKKEANINWFSLGYHKRPTVPATIFDIVRGSLYGAYLVLKNRINVIHARAIVAALAGYPVAKLFFKKFIFDMRGIDSEEYVDAGLWKRGGLKHKAVSSLETFLLKSSDHVVVLTEKFLNILKEKYADRKIRFSVIPCAVDTDRFKLHGKDTALAEKLGVKDKFVIAYVGSLGTWYMLGEMLDFFKAAGKFVKNAHFLILTQTGETYVRDFMKAKGLDETSVTVSLVEPEAVPRYLSICDVGLFFIKPVFSKLSSSPTKFAEYLSMGLPVITNSGIGDTEEVVKRYNLGAVINDFGKEAYIGAIKSVTDMLRTEKDALTSRCREAAERELSLGMASRRYREIYNELEKRDKYYKE